MGRLQAPLNGVIRTDPARVLTDIVSLVRYALGQRDSLAPMRQRSPVASISGLAAKSAPGAPTTPNSSTGSKRSAITLLRTLTLVFAISRNCRGSRSEAAFWLHGRCLVRVCLT